MLIRCTYCSFIYNDKLSLCPKCGTLRDKEIDTNNANYQKFIGVFAHIMEEYEHICTTKNVPISLSIGTYNNDLKTILSIETVEYRKGLDIILPSIKPNKSLLNRYNIRFLKYKETSLWAYDIPVSVICSFIPDLLSYLDNNFKNIYISIQDNISTICKYNQDGVVIESQNKKQSYNILSTKDKLLITLVIILFIILTVITIMLV